MGALMNFSEACQICNSVYAECRKYRCRMSAKYVVDDVDNKEYLTLNYSIHCDGDFLHQSQERNNKKYPVYLGNAL